MIDANSQFFAILTNVGMAKQANADALGVAWRITEMGVGDANPGGLADPPNPVPAATQTKLLSEWRRKPLNQLRVDPVNPAVIIAEQIIPADEGGKWIREIGLYDADGDLVAVANCAPSFKPLLSQGSGRTQVVRMNFVVSSTGNITLKIDPAVVLATREYVDSRILDELSKLDIKQSVRAATTANISLVGLQTIDGVALAVGDRVLVKNQAAAKDNGPYVVAVGSWVRAKDADSNAKITPNLTVAVEAGSTQADTIWQLVTDAPIVVGTTALTFKDITDGFARLFSPSFAGNPTAPTPALFDNSKSLATTEFAQRAQGSYADLVTYPGSVDLSPADVGRLVAPGGSGSTVTLPDASAVPQGAVVTVLAGLNGATFKAKAGQSLIAINGALGPFTQPQSTISAFRRLNNGQGWALEGGDGALKYSPILRGAHWETQPQFDNGKSLATTEFVQRAMGNFSGRFDIAALPATLSVAAAGQRIVLSASGTLTLPPVSSVPTGTNFFLFNTTPGVVNIVRQGTDVISALSVSSMTSVPLQSLSTIVITAGNGQWVVENGMSALKYAPEFGSSFGNSGYQRLPSGAIEQWGTGVTDANGYVYVTFPIPFPNAPRNITLTHVGSMCLMHALMGAGLGASGCTLRVQNAAGTAQALWSVQWRAVGN
ncbi:MULTISPECIES: phage tail protein [unclassified Pseudomonas]|uniref:phage tail protein n=1 Tax=unclassified Pseudomonas TaxID=196821 RepID=UPI000449D5A1|nr:MULTISPECIES: phage tail protein [unclassified Pseudomonas]EZP31917.1 Phage tail fiber protein h [Pseudomonas sp. RIT288]